MLEAVGRLIDASFDDFTSLIFLLVRLVVLSMYDVLRWQFFCLFDYGYGWLWRDSSPRPASGCWITLIPTMHEDE